MKTKTKPKIIATRMWADYEDDVGKAESFQVYPRKSDQRGNRPDLIPIPVFVIRGDLIEALVEQMALSILTARRGGSLRGIPPVELGDEPNSQLSLAKADVRTGLASLGITQRRKR